MNPLQLLPMEKTFCSRSALNQDDDEDGDDVSCDAFGDGTLVCTYSPLSSHVSFMNSTP